MNRELADADYQRLLEFRTGLRRFLQWSEERAAEVGLTPGQHQLLLAVCGHAASEAPTIGEIADHLLLKHHSAVGLVDRAVAAELLVRERDAGDQRVVRLRLTKAGRQRIAALSALHRDELARLGPRLEPLWAGLEDAAP